MTTCAAVVSNGSDIGVLASYQCVQQWCCPWLASSRGQPISVRQAMQEQSVDQIGAEGGVGTEGYSNAVVKVNIVIVAVVLVSLGKQQQGGCGRNCRRSMP